MFLGRSAWKVSLMVSWRTIRHLRLYMLCDRGQMVQHLSTYGFFTSSMRFSGGWSYTSTCRKCCCLWICILCFCFLLNHDQLRLTRVEDRLTCGTLNQVRFKVAWGCGYVWGWSRRCWKLDVRCYTSSADGQWKLKKSWKQTKHNMRNKTERKYPTGQQTAQNQLTPDQPTCWISAGSFLNLEFYENWCNKIAEMWINWTV